MKKINVLMAMLIVTIAMPIFAQGNAEGSSKTYKLRTSTNLAATGTIGKSLTKFVELVNEKSDGRIVATANFGSELGNQSEQVEMCRTGSLEMVVAAPGTGPGIWRP